MTLRPRPRPVCPFESPVVLTAGQQVLSSCLKLTPCTPPVSLDAIHSTQKVRGLSMCTLVAIHMDY